MTFVSQGLVTGDIFACTLPGLQSFRPVVFLAGTSYPIGAMLGRVTATGKYKYYTPGATDGSEIALGIAKQAVDATAGDVTDGIAWFGLEYRRQKIAWGPAVTTAAHKATAETQLEARGMLAVNEG